MELFLFSYISGIISGILSILFRMKEKREKTVYIGKQFLLQILFFIFIFFLLQKYYFFYELSIFSVQLSWFWIFFIVSNLSYYSIKIVFEWYFGFPLYPTDKELEEILNNLEK